MILVQLVLHVSNLLTNLATFLFFNHPLKRLTEVVVK